MKILIILYLAACAYCIVSFIAVMRKSRGYSGAAVKTVSAASGFAAVYGTVGSDRTVRSSFSGTACVYYEFTIEYECACHTDDIDTPDLVGNDNVKKSEWITLYRDSSYVPFYISDASGMALSVDSRRADFDVYPETSAVVNNIEDDAALYSKILPLIAPDKRILLKNPIRIREEFLMPGSNITVVSNVRNMSAEDILEYPQIENESVDACVSFEKRIYVDRSASAIKYTERYNGRNIYISDDPPSVLLGASKRKKILSGIGAFVSAAAAVIAVMFL